MLRSFQNLRVEHGGQNARFLDLQNPASEHSCVAAAAQAGEMLAGARAGRFLEGHWAWPDAEPGEVLPRGVGRGLLGAWSLF